MVNYGFAIDNRKCIGCHACTVACKSEHDVPVGVNRTHVKYIETGQYPNSNREFSVHRCNHCEDAPCTTICPTTALFTRSDGIVDFDDDRCIGCKSCMQACPYDALYINPNTGTAAKCNYCAHRIENSYEPACVIVCPVEAIVSGDLDDPQSNLSQLIAEHDTKVRKPEAGTIPNVYYLDTSDEMLNPLATEKTPAGMWSEQAAGVGHFAKYAHERLGAADEHSMIVQLALDLKAKKANPRDQAIIRDVAAKLADTSPEAKRSYDAPSKGILWGWEVSAYIWTKGIAAGTYMVAMMLWLAGYLDMTDLWLPVTGIGLGFLAITGVLLIMDLDRPDRFLYVMLRPNWNSWLVKGAYILAAYGGILFFSAVLAFFTPANYELYLEYLAYAGIPIAALTGVYTAWLLQQAKGRSWSKDSWLPIKFLIETALIGGATLAILVGVLLSGNFIAVFVGVIALVIILIHGHHVIEKPQLEPLL
ncbi:MAG: polysulfide reductase NrfD [archaeon]|nr:polysulfide reductase NrfD [archaeon]MDA0842724.1 polysulfide reductase NrfD [archaeon]MDA1168248.1 polysulfide reductase NrfD [archaeon]